MDRKGFLGALGLGAIAAKLGGGTTAQAAPVSPEPLSLPARKYTGVTLNVRAMDGKFVALRLDASQANESLHRIEHAYGRAYQASR